ncbi:hypothetical protein [Pseudoroseomonas cervicalis]|uniref:hypothetical protein n=1 Tax=Teichococcus cervicalis TaxID=204525 RepID=UPI002786BB27|nr:hypothetical protein [Pseudoroseomonas cervicalis]MDQ1078622.1 hypothetical protein [Pseudoroseomonas cervicalis]
MHPALPRQPRPWRWLRAAGPARLVGLGFLAELGWAGFGSLGLGLGMRGAEAARWAWPWLGGAVALALLAGLAALLAELPPAGHPPLPPPGQAPPR